MSKEFTNTDQYTATPAQMWAMLSDKSYTEAKYAELGAENLEWTNFEASEDAVMLSSVREVAANLPAAAKKIIGEKAVVTQIEKWTKSGDTFTCEFDMTTKGAPGGTKGSMSIKPTGDGSAWSADFEIHVPIPFLGKKLEGIMYDETEGNFVKEKSFNDSWLASH